MIRGVRQGKKVRTIVIDTLGELCYSLSMSLYKYLWWLIPVFLGLLVTPLSAQDDAGELDTFEETAEVADDESADDDVEEGSEKKSKKKKKKKSKKSSKSKKDGKDDADAKPEKKDSAESAVVEAFGKFKNVGGKLNVRALPALYACGH